MNKVVFVDNLSSCFFIDLDAGVPIIPYNGDMNDKELISLSRFLQNLSKKNNYRDVISKSFGLDCLRGINNFELAIKTYIKYHDDKYKFSSD